MLFRSFIATTTGFGFLIHDAQVQLDTTAIMAYMLIAGLVGFLMDRFVLVLEDVLLRWKRGA